MLKKIKLPKNKLSCFHYHNLTDEEREYITFNIDPVKFLNNQIKFFNCYTEETISKYPHIKKELEILKSLIEKLDIFDRDRI